MTDFELLHRLRELTDAHLGDPHFGAPQLRAALGLSERSFYRRVRAATGCAPAAYVRTARLAQAQALLLARARRTVAEVAYAVGFDSPGYFAAVYWRHYGRRATEDLRETADA